MSNYKRDVQCLGVGGNVELYAFPFVKYSRSQIKIENNYLTLFPYSAIYKINGLKDVSFSEQVSNEVGGLQVNQDLNYNLIKITPTDILSDFVNKQWRFIAKDNNGYYRLIGLRKSLDGQYNKVTGQNKSDFNGFNFSFKGIEEEEAPFLENLDGFDIIDGDFLLKENGFFLLLEDLAKIKL